MENARDLFDVPDDVCYLNCAYMSPLLKSVRDAGHRGVDREAPTAIHGFVMANGRSQTATIDLVTDDAFGLKPAQRGQRSV